MSDISKPQGAVTRSELETEIKKLDPAAELFTADEQDPEWLVGIVVTDMYEESEPDILRSQKLWYKLKEVFRERMGSIGPLTVFTHSEWNRRLAS